MFMVVGDPSDFICKSSAIVILRNVSCDPLFKRIRTGHFLYSYINLAQVIDNKFCFFRMSSSLTFVLSVVCKSWWCFLPHSSTGHRGSLQVLELWEMFPACRQLKHVGAPLRLISISHHSSGVLLRASGHFVVSWVFTQNPHFVFL